VAVPPAPRRAPLLTRRRLRSVEANTRADGEDLLGKAAAVPIRPTVTPFTIAQANEALIRLKADQLDGTGVLVLEASR
jgi:alcohol dehydrogenase, propanol-preferring